MKLSCLLLVETTKSSRSGAWLAPLVPNGGFVRMTSKRSDVRDLVDRVAEADVRLDLVEVEVHEREPARPCDQFLAVVGLVRTRLAMSRSSAPLVSSMSHS